MVRDLSQDNKVVFQCEECGWRYRERVWANKCEAWCREHKSCHLEIMQHGEPPPPAA